LISQTRIKLNSGWIAEFYLIGYSRINLLQCLGLRFKKLSEPSFPRNWLFWLQWSFTTALLEIALHSNRFSSLRGTESIWWNTRKNGIIWFIRLWNG